MSFIKNPGRVAGLLYIISSVFGVFGLLYVPSKLIVHGNASATADNILSSETLFRAGIVADLFCHALFILVALALYYLLKDVNQRLAVSMLILILMSIPIVFLNEVKAIAALVLVRGADFLALFGKPDREALAMFFLKLHGYGFDVAAIFWGLWLFPLGLLVYRSRFIPRILGILLMIGCFGYLANSFTSLMVPQYQSIVSRFADPVQAVEMLFMIWLAIMGARPRPVADPAYAPARA